DDAAGAKADQVDIRAAGDLTDRVDGGRHRLSVGVEVPVTLLGSRVAPAEHEGPQPATGGVLDKAAPGPQVQEVEPPDGRRDDKDRALEYRVSGRAVLDELRDRVPGDDGAGGHGQIPAHLEGAGFDHRRHRTVVADVVDEIAGSPGQAHAAGVEGALEGGRVAHQEVRRRGGAGHDAGREL